MDKNAIKKFAVWARTELIARVSLKGVEYGITEECEQWKADDEHWSMDSVNGKVLTDDEKRQRTACIAEIKDKGYKQVMEEVAYTWFNRFSALRFMEVNGYLPSHVRVFTDEDNNFKPQIISEAIHLNLDGLDMKKVYELKDAEKTEELYKYLLIVQCNALNKILPGMFQKIADYTELLLPDNLLREGSVIQQMIELIPEDDWKDAVQIIGWLYQYYNSEKKDDVFAALKKNVKITKENIPAATQLFTPDWIVRYMVENSLGRLWLEGHPDVKEQLLPTEEEQSAYAAGNRDPEDTKWHYYLEEAEQEPEVQAQLAEIRKEYAALTPNQLKVIDPCSGSGHILAYMFDVLMKIYESYGYTTPEAVASIVENNLYGLDIDDRAAQLAYFAVMMKARQYDRRFFSRGIQPHVYAIVESNHVDKFAVDYFCNGDMKLTAAMDTIINELHDAKEYGSILTVTPQDWSSLYDRFAEITEDINMSRETALRELLPLVQVAEIMAQTYHVIVTNPPYMGANGMGVKLSEFVKKFYPDTKYDMSTVCMEKSLKMCHPIGYISMINIPVWMFLSSYERLRNSILSQNTISNMVHFGRGVFGSDFGTTAFVIHKRKVTAYKALYRRLFEKQGAVDSVDVKEKWFFEGKGQYIAQQEDFSNIPGAPIAYWVKNKELFLKGVPLEQIANPRQGMKTLDNDYFIRLWYEVNIESVGFECESLEKALLSKRKWFPLNHGGEFRRYYGNNYEVVNWENDGFEMKQLATKKYKSITRTITNIGSYFKEGITWTVISSASTSFRRYGKGFMFSNSGQSIVPETPELLDYLTGLLNSEIVQYVLSILSPTLGFESGYLKKIPVRIDKDKKTEVEFLARKNIGEEKEDWDSFETSWDFKKHPLIIKSGTLKEAFDIWSQVCERRFLTVKENDEKLNEIFIDMYNLNGELSKEIMDTEVTVRKADLGRDIRSFISYAVGCMFGRYSLDVDGLAYAGGEWDASKYACFAADKDNIIPICDDEYFEDDIVGLFVEFVKTVYGAETLDENLKFIADALGGKGQPKDVIRNYFLSDFYSDHCKIYQKCPIYWLFDSGKKNGFKALIYMHRYQPDTIARIRTDYVHEQQARYRTAIADLEQRIANASTAERVKLNKKLTTLQAQDTEIRTYEEKMHHLADQMISIDLDDGVKKNYAIFQNVLAKIK